MICMKTTFITDINKIKFEVNTEVARLAFAGELDEKANEIPYKLIPGRTPHYRCCVLKNTFFFPMKLIAFLSFI